MLSMRKRFKSISILTVIAFIFSLLSGFISATPAYANNAAIPNHSEGEVISKEAQSTPETPSVFIMNKGQHDGNVSFYANLPMGTMFVTQKGELVYSLFKTVESTDPQAESEIKGWVLKETLVNTNKIKPKALKELKAKVNYFIGNDKNKWQRGIKTYSGLSLGEAYPGIEVILNAKVNNVEKIFKVLPGSSASQIEIKVEGTEKLSVNENGELEIVTGLGSVAFTKPVAYQAINGQRKYVPVKYQINQNTYGFEVGEYDETRPLIIDPLLASTYFGENSKAKAIKLDSSDNVYITGYTGNSNFPTTVGAYDRTYDGVGDAYVAKLNDKLDTLFACTYIGGNGGDIVTSLEIDSEGTVYLAGYTSSSNYPTTNGAYDETFNTNNDIFISKLDSGLSNLLSSTYLGGPSSDNAYSMTLDKDGNVLVAGTTMSGFPVTSGVYDTTHNGGNDGFIAKLSSGLTSLMASTYIGRQYTDEAKAIKSDSSGNIYIAGYTQNSTFPVTAGAFDTTFNQGVVDAFVSTFTPDLTQLLYSTFIGGDYWDEAISMALDHEGNVFVTGKTYGNFPTTSGAFSRIYKAGYEVFISKFQPNLGTLLASTYIGGTKGDEPRSILIDSTGGIHVAGKTDSTDFPTTQGAFDRIHNGGTDGFYSILDDRLSKLIDSTFLGGSFTDEANDLAIDNSGYTYLTGQASSINFPTTSGVYQEKTKGGGSFVTKFFRSISGFDAVDYFLYYIGIGDNALSLWADPIDTSTGAHVISRDLLTVTGAREFKFQVQYNSLLLKDDAVGKGWSHNYEAHLECLDNGGVNVHWDANRTNHFYANGSGQYVPADLSARYDHLVENADGTYTLTKKDQTAYDFDTEGKLISVKNSYNQPINLAYDASGKLTTATEPISGRSLSFFYNNSGMLEKVTDPLNREVTFGYDAEHNLVSITDTAGNPTTYTYNSLGQVLTAKDANNETIFINTYDSLGRVITQDDARTDNQLTRFSYDETSQPGKLITTITDRNGKTRILTHDSKYRLQRVTNENGLVEDRYEYYDNGDVKSAIDSDNNKTTYIYDQNGNLLTSKDPTARITSMTYDTRNNLLTIEFPNSKKITNTYDDNNHITSTTDQLDNKTEYVYDSSGLLKEKIMPRLGKTTYAYVSGQVYLVTDPAGNAVQFGYDAAGRLASTTDAEGNVTSIQYDALDNIISVTDPLRHTKTYTYDIRGNKTDETDPRGNTISYRYNGNDKLTEVIDTVNNHVYYQYDGEDRLVTTIDARGNSIVNTYDNKGRLINITDQTGSTFRFEYDNVDNIVKRYDAMNRLISTGTYDAMHNLLAETDALNRTTTMEYDVMDRLHSVTDPMSNISSFSYDGLNRVVAARDALDGLVTQGFDADGNRTVLIDQNNNQTSFSYDLAGRIISETNAAGDETTYEYNSRNLISRSTNARGQVTTYQYDDAGRLTSFTDPAGTVTYTYDANGNVLTVSDSTGTITREYDKLNRVTKYTDVFGNVIEYEYDANDNLTTLVYPGGKTVTYGYDKANRLTTVTDWANRVTTYEYDVNGRLTKTVRPNGTTQTISYDAAGQILQMKDTDSSGVILSQYDFTYDDIGSILTEQVQAGSNTYTLDNSYDGVNQLLQQQKLDGSSILIDQRDFSYDAGGNMLVGQAVYSGPSTVMSYAYDNRLATYNGHEVTYDADGNMTYGPLNGLMVNFNWDARNRLTGVGNMSYLYDALNNRVSVTETVYGSERETRYIINPNASLSQTLIKIDSDGNQTFYVYGLGLIGEEKEGAYRTYHYDMRGSTVAISDENGSVTDRFEYGPYGELLNHIGTTETAFLYNGRDGVMTDANGLYYMRARYYNPEIKRFISEDSFEGKYDNLLNINLHQYAGSNPIIYIDPLGTKFGEGFSETADKAFRWLDDAGTAMMINDPMPNGGHPITFIDNMGGTVLAGLGKGGKLLTKALTKTDDVYDVAKRTSKAVNLPSWKKVKIDMSHVLSGHTSGGSRVAQNGIKDLFSNDMTSKQIETAIMDAYKSGKKLKTQGDRVQVVGKSRNMNIEMWVNVKTNIIETAYPKF